MGAHEQIGLVALSSCREYESGAIRKHEFTRPDKEDDWVSHMESLEAQTGAVFLTYPADPELDRKFSAVVSRTVQVDFSSEDGVRHSAWVIAEEEELRFIEERFAEIPRLYIADSHQRSAAASRVAKDRAEKNGSGGFLYSATITMRHLGRETQVSLHRSRGAFCLTGLGRSSGKRESICWRSRVATSILRRDATVQEGTDAVTLRANYPDTGGNNGSDKNCLEKKNRLVSLE